MVTVLTYHHPLRVAEEIRMLDALTGGRLEVGVGPGGIPRERAAWGMASDQAGAVFEAACALVLRFLEEQAVDYDTAWWRGSNVTIAPEPTQRPRPPMWRTAVGGPSIDKAARQGLHCAGSFADLGRLRARLDRFRQAWSAHHDDVGRARFAALVPVVVAETERDAVRYGRAAVQAKVDHFARVFASGPPGGDGADRHALARHLSGLSFDGLRDEGVIVFGSVDQCVEQLELLRSTGVDVVVAWGQIGGLDRDFAASSLQLLGEQVIPRVERRPRLALAEA